MHCSVRMEAYMHLYCIGRLVDKLVIGLIQFSLIDSERLLYLYVTECIIVKQQIHKRLNIFRLSTHWH